MVMLAFAVRLKVVASLKVTPSVEFAEVCSTSLRKISSCTFSVVGVLLRVTVAVPVTVATFPIGSSSGGCAVGGGARGGESRGCGRLRLRHSHRRGRGVSGNRDLLGFDRSVICFGAGGAAQQNK